MLLNGVRELDSGSQGIIRESAGQASSLRESLDEVKDPTHLDASVGEVLETMLGVRSIRIPVPDEPVRGSITAVVGFGGALSGACILRCTPDHARAAAALLTGMTFDDVDDVVKDAMGEICNMLAGVWKGKVPTLAERCGLSVPAVITGHDYSLHVQAPEFQLHHAYGTEELSFEVLIICDGLL